MPSSGQRILIVDDEKDICDILFRFLEKKGYSPIVANSGETALEMLKLGIPDLMLLDVRMPGMDGMEALRKAKRLSPQVPILMITGWGGIDGAVTAMKEGAFDYLSKPLDKVKLLAKITEALAHKTPSVPKISIDEKSDLVLHFKERMGRSDAISHLISEIALVAPSNFSVVIQGETGTGKELVANAVHNAGPRSKFPIIPVDCGAIPETLFESELFGYEKGAFTGAVADRPGKFQLAQGGTLFLDEITNMPQGSQIKLLRAIQERTFFKVGGAKPVHVDVRVITATNISLSLAVRSGSFSRDLFYRLSEFTVAIPPLRDRREDILHIAKRILKETNEELAKAIQGFSDEAATVLTEARWPGNVRQLRTVVRRAALHADSRILPEHIIWGETCELPECQEDNTPAEEWEGLSLKDIVRRHTIEVERNVLTRMLKKTGGNKAKAARLLKIDYTTIHAKLKQYGITVDQEE